MPASRHFIGDPVSDTELMEEPNRRGTFRAVKGPADLTWFRGLLWALLALSFAASVILLIAMRKS